jgi:hypothetical protein
MEGPPLLRCVHTPGHVFVDNVLFYEKQGCVQHEIAFSGRHGLPPQFLFEPHVQVQDTLKVSDTLYRSGLLLTLIDVPVLESSLGWIPGHLPLS